MLSYDWTSLWTDFDHFRRDVGKELKKQVSWLRKVRKYNPNLNKCSFISLSLSLSPSLPRPLLWQLNFIPLLPPTVLTVKVHWVEAFLLSLLKQQGATKFCEFPGWKVLKAWPGSQKALEEQGGNRLWRRRSSPRATSGEMDGMGSSETFTSNIPVFINTWEKNQL